MGMGTLHLGDKISGLTDPKEINAWIQEAVSLGITLFDLAVSSGKGVMSYTYTTCCSHSL